MGPGNTLKLFAIVGLFVAAGVGSSFAVLQGANRRRAAAFWLAWLIPGLGHLALGRTRKALFFFAVTAAMYLFGLWICGWHTVAFDDNPFYYVGQFGSGATLVLGQVLGVEKAHPGAGGLPVAWYDPGLLYVCVAGIHYSQFS